MLGKRNVQSGISALLGGDAIAHVDFEGRRLFSLMDLVAVLSDGDHPERVWAEMIEREPALGELPEVVDGNSGRPMQVVDLEGVLRIVDSSSSAGAQRYKGWIARAVAQRIEEQDNPELAILRTRQVYEAQGYDRHWIEKRLRGIASRHELTEEWFKRGAKDRQDFRDLTNLLFQSAFGMDVQAQRNHKGLTRAGDNLRDHMTDRELILTTLAESSAALLAHERDSHGMNELANDVREAGAMVAGVRGQLESMGQRRSMESLVGH